MSKSKLSLEDGITLAQNNAIDFTHACVTIALNEKFGIGKERQKKVNAVRNEVRRMCAPKALPLAPAEVEKRIQTALQYGTPDSWQRRRTR